MLVTTTGVVIRERATAENYKYVDVLTADYGVIEIVIRGKKYLSAMQLFAFSKICYDKRKTSNFLNSAEPLKIFYTLRMDVDKLSLASYFSEVVSYAIPPDQDSGEILRLYLNTIYFLSEGTRDIRMLKSIFELRFMSEIGMMPNVGSCSCCNNTAERLYFVLEDATICCDKCFVADDSKTFISLTSAALKAVRHIISSDFERLYNFNIKELCQNKLSYISESYLLTHLGRNFKTLDFYKVMADN